jgi:hypothetical protein
MYKVLSMLRVDESGKWSAGRPVRESTCVKSKV